MNSGIILACIAVTIFNIIDSKEHNKKVNETWPDYSDQQQTSMRLRFTLGLGGQYILLAILICFFIKTLITEIMNV